MSATTLMKPGFADPVFQSQAAFRALLDTLAEPGIARELPVTGLPAGLSPATATALLTLADYETPLWLPPVLAQGEAAAWLRFHCGTPLVAEPGAALFAVLDAGADGPRLADFSPGEDAFPDRSATVIVQCPALAGGEEVELTGPGIATTWRIAPAGLRAGFWAEVTANAALYPLGVDLLFVAGTEAMGLPRSTQVRAVV